MMLAAGIVAAVIAIFFLGMKANQEPTINPAVHPPTTVELPLSPTPGSPIAIRDQLDRTFDPATVGAPVTYLESIVGKPTATHGNVSTYLVGDKCELAANVVDGKVKALEMSLGGVCDVALNKVFYTKTAQAIPGQPIFASTTSPEAVSRYLNQWDNVGVRCAIDQLCMRENLFGFFYQNGGNYSAAGNRALTLTTELDRSSPTVIEWSTRAVPWLNETYNNGGKPTDWYSPVGFNHEGYAYTELVTSAPTEMSFIVRHANARITRVRYETFD